jgi:hypothetical protein
VRTEILIPLFAGVLCSLLSCALIAVFNGFFQVPVVLPEIVIEIKPEEEETEFLFTPAENVPDLVLEYFRDPEYQEWVIEFFSGLCSNREVAKAILENADKFDVPPSLAFALSWEESKFNPYAVNRRNRDGSIDRGLFQLNNRSFPNLDIIVFFDIRSNAHYGISHLKHCMDSAASEVSALAMYNAGTGRVKSTGAPEITLNYINRILNNRSRIESRFHSKLIKEEESRMEETDSDDPPLHYNRTLITASPL